MNRPMRYKLEVNLSIVREEWSGPTNPDGTVKTDNSNPGYWSVPMGNERLTVNETMPLGSMNFMELMSVLSQLHEALLNVSSIPTE